MQVDILTLFPDMFAGPFDQSILKRAQEKGLLNIKIHNLRDYTADAYHTVDDHPYGGGPGMVMMVEPIDKALKSINAVKSNTSSRIILTSARGQTFTQSKAQEFSQLDRLVLIAGHYEGVDQRVADHLVDEELSIGNFVVTGGELPVMVMIDTTARLLTGVLGKSASLDEESHNVPGYLEYPQYTRPENYRGWSVPQVLLSGNHQDITKWHQDHTRRLEQ